MKKKIYLHIGTEKTGTSTIQSFCHLNSKKMEEYDVLYPIKPNKCYVHGNTHWPLAASVAEKKGFVAEEKRLPSKEMYKELINDIEESSLSKIILSAEPFSSHVLKIEEMKEVKELLSNYDVKIIIYIRKQDDTFISRVSTQVKGGRIYKDDNFIIDDALTEKEIYDYEYILGKWESVFGKENLIVKLFNREKMKNNDILDDFFDIIGINIDSLDRGDTKVNQSLNLDTLYFLNYANQEINMTPKERNYFFKLLELIPSKNSIKNLISPKERKEIMKKYELSNIEVGKKYFEGKKIFNKEYNLEKYNEYKGLSNQSSKKIFEFLNDTISFKKFDREKYEILKEIYDADVESEGVIKTNNHIIQKYQNIIKNSNKAEFFRDLAVYLEYEKQLDAAYYFMTLAKKENPTGPYINEKLLKYQKEILRSLKGE